MVAVSENALATAVLCRSIELRYSGIPVFRNSVDDIVGVVFSTKLVLSIDMGYELLVVDKSWCEQRAGQLMSTCKALQKLKK